MDTLAANEAVEKVENGQCRPAAETLALLLVTSNIAAVGPEEARYEEIAAPLTVDVQSYRRIAHIAL